MKFLIKITGFALLVTFCAAHVLRAHAESQSQNQNVFPEANRDSVPPGKLKADLAFLVETIERVHPNPYAYTSKTQHLDILQELYRDCDHAMSASEFYLYAHVAVSCLKDSHTGIERPSCFTMPKITEPMRERLNRTVNNDKAPKSEASYVAPPRKKEYGGPYSHHFFPEYHTCLIVLDSFGDPGEVTQYARRFQETFKMIMEKGITNVVIDIRENRGGCGFSGDELLTYLATKPFRQLEQIEQRIVPEFLKLCEHYGMDIQRAMAEEYGIDLKLLKDRGDYKPGMTVTGRIPFKKPREPSQRFKGSIYVLIAHPTFSAAANFAAAVQAFAIGTLIGEETSGERDHYGQVLPIQLPNSGLKGQVSTAHFIAADGVHDPGGIKPDYEVHQKSEDTARGADTVLDFTLNLIAKGSIASKTQSVN